MRKKVLIFGASNGGINFLKHTKEDLEVLAFVDNDESKNGTLFSKYKVISPSQINSYEYDEIIIASYYAIEIKEQLESDETISNSKIKVVKKAMLKDVYLPFEDSETLKFARELIINLCGEAYRKKLPLHLDYGTLIGIVRDSDIISWDDDIDLAILDKYEKELEEFLLHAELFKDERVKWKLEKRVDKDGVVMEYFIKFVSSDYKFFSTSISLKQKIDDTLITKKSSFGEWNNPAYCIETLDTISWNETDMYIPSDVDAYLGYMYGDWKTPKKDMQMTDFENRIEIPFSQVQQHELKMITIFEQEI